MGPHSPRACLWLYQAVVRPVVTYGAVVWWTRNEMATAKDQLTRMALPV